MPFLTRKSVALITASSAGVGAAAARSLASSGARVVVNYLSSREKADALLEELSLLDPRSEVHDNEETTTDQSPRFIAIQADVTRRTELIRLVEESVAAMGRLDVVVSNQGWTRIRDFYNLDDNMDERDWDMCFTAYSVTKAAQIHLVKALALTAGSIIRVNSVSPGILLTDWGRQFTASKIETAISKSPLKRLATVEDVAQQILYFANSQSVTGTNSVIDAGYSL